MKNKILVICIIVFMCFCIQKVEAKYSYKKEKEIFMIKNADNQNPVINNRNYSVYDEVFTDDVTVIFYDNIGIKTSTYIFNNNLEDVNNNELEFVTGSIFSESGYYKIKVIDLYDNFTEYSFCIDKEVNEAKLEKISMDNLGYNIKILGKDELSYVEKIELYVDNKIYEIYDYAEKSEKMIEKEINLSLEDIRFYQDVYIIVYDKLGNYKKSESIILNVDNINSIVDLYRFKDIVNNKICDFSNKIVYLKSNLNLDLKNVNDWEGISGFKGEFNGNLHTISGFYMDKDTEKMALFADNYGIIKNLIVSR